MTKPPYQVERIKNRISLMADYAKDINMSSEDKVREINKCKTEVDKMVNAYYNHYIERC